jgi:hypothetical protein
MKQEPDIILVEKDGIYMPENSNQKSKTRFVKEEPRPKLTREQKRERNRMAGKCLVGGFRGNVKRAGPLSLGYAAIDTATHYLTHDHSADLAIRGYTAFLWWVPVAYAATALVSTVASYTLGMAKYRQVATPREDQKRLLPGDLTHRGRKFGLAAGLLLTAFQYGNHQLSKGKYELPFAPNYNLHKTHKETASTDARKEMMVANFVTVQEQSQLAALPEPQPTP